MGVPGFGVNGVQIFGGSDADASYSIALSGTTVFVGGYSDSSDAGFGGLGTFSASGDGVVLAVNATTGAPVSGFGTGGFLHLVGSNNVNALAASATTLYIGGVFDTNNLGIGAAGSVATSGSFDAFVAAVSVTTGAPVSGFGVNGIQKIGGSGYDGVDALFVSGSTVFAAGYFASGDAGIAGKGTLASSGGNDAFVCALSASTGAAIGTFGSGGLLKFGGTDSDSAYGVAVVNSTLYLAGGFNSTDAGVQGTGAFDFTGFGGFILPMDAATGKSIPRITSSLAALGRPMGSTLNYTITATDSPTSYSATGLPAGLAIVNNVISGTVQAAGNFNIVLSATNSFGTGSAILPLTVVGDAVANRYPPVIQGSAQAVAVDTNGNRYVTGTFTGPYLDFNPGTGLDYHACAGMTDVFVTRFNADGSYAWTRTFGGSDVETAQALAVAGNVVYVTGSFRSIDAGFDGPGTFASAGSEDVFVLALNAGDGTPVSAFGTGGAQRFGGTGSDIGRSIAVLGSTVYVAGQFDSSSANTGGIGNIASSGLADAFVLALNTADGKPVNAFGFFGVQHFGGTGSDVANALTISGSTLYIAGNFNSTNAGVGGTGSGATTGGWDAFVLALKAADGTPMAGFGSSGLQRIGGTGTDYANGIAVANGVVYVIGQFNSADAGINGTGAAGSLGGFDAYVAAINATTGNTISGFGTGGIQRLGGIGDENGLGLCVVNNTLFAAGNFASINFGIGGIGTASSSGGTDAFVAALNPVNGSAVTTFGANGIQQFGGARTTARAGSPRWVRRCW